MNTLITPYFDIMYTDDDDPDDYCVPPERDRTVEDSPFIPNDIATRILGGRRPVGYRIAFNRLNRSNDPQRMCKVLKMMNDRSYSIARKVIDSSSNLFQYVIIVEIQFVSKVHHARFETMMDQFGAKLTTLYP